MFNIPADSVCVYIECESYNIIIYNIYYVLYKYLCACGKK